MKETVKARRAERLIRVAPMEDPLKVCDVLWAKRMLPKWLEAFRAEARGTSPGSGASLKTLPVVNCEVRCEPEMWLFSRDWCTAHFAVEYTPL